MKSNIDIQDILSPRKLQNFLRQNKLIAKKGLGQNFLINKDILTRIVESSCIKEDDIVIEVGPGLGFLTYFLLKKGAKVYSFEKDRSFFGHLEDTFKNEKKFTLIKEDFLRAELNKHVPIEKGFHVVANLPYNITSPVFDKLLKLNELKTMTVTVQRQVGERIVSSHAKKTWGAFSLFCQFYADTELLFHISPGNFHPAPSVYSSVVKLIRHEPLLDDNELKVFFKVVKAVFTSRRKTLKNNFKNATFLKAEKEEVERILNIAQISPSQRGENLTLEQFVHLAKLFADVV